MFETVVAHVREDHVLIELPDGSTTRVDCPVRALAGILLPEWVASAVENWSHGRMTARPVEALNAGRVPVPIGARTHADRVRDRHHGGFASLGQVHAAGREMTTCSFRLQPRG